MLGFFKKEGGDDGSGLTGRTLDGLVWIFSSSSLQSALKIVVTAILARLLVPSEFGLMSAALVVIGFATMTSKLGVGQAIVQLPEIGQHHIRSGFTFSVGVGLIMTGFLWLTSPWIAALFRMPDLVDIFKIVIWLFPLQAVSSISSNLIQRDLNYRKMAGVHLVSYALGYGIVGITLAYLDFGVYALVWAALGQSLLSAIIYFKLQPHSIRPQFDWSALKELLFVGSGFTLGSVLNYMARKGDDFVVGRWLGEHGLGIYSRAYALMNASNSLVGNVINKVFFPAFSKIQDDTERLARAYRRSMSLVSFFMLPAGVACIILAPEIVLVLLGEQWTEVILPFQILAAGMVLRLGYKMAGTLVRGCGAVYRLAWIQAAYALAAVGGGWIGHHWGVPGVAWSTLVALGIQFLLLNWLCLQLTDLRWSQLFGEFLPALRPTFMAGGLVLAIAHLLRSVALSPFIILPATVCLTGILLLLILLFAPRLLLGTNSVWLLRKIAAYLPTDSITAFETFEARVEAITAAVDDVENHDETSPSNRGE